MLAVLDSGPLMLLTTPRGHEVGDRCREWADSILARGWSIAVAGIADYECRRSLIRRRQPGRIFRLDMLADHLGFLPITQDALAHAAHLWAEARREGRQTAADKSLDADCILAAQAILAAHGDDVVIATTNDAHLARYCPAEHWEAIGAD